MKDIQITSPTAAQKLDITSQNMMSGSMTVGGQRNQLGMW